MQLSLLFVVLVVTCVPMLVTAGTWLKPALLESVSSMILLHPVVLPHVPPVKPLAMMQLVWLWCTRPTGTFVNRSAVLFRKNRIWQPLGTSSRWCRAVLVLLTTRRHTSD